jgi:hypothetical protein
MIDYEQIIEDLSIDKVIEILNKLEIPFEDKGAYLLMPTYCHNHKTEEASKKLYFYKNNKLFVCWTECGNMSIFKFLRNYYEAQGIDYNWYTDIYQLIVGDAKPEGIVVPKYRSKRNDYERRKEVNLPSYPPGVLGCFIKHYPAEWEADGISHASMDKYNIRFSISQNKIIIPHYSARDGQLVGIRGRALNPTDIEQYGKYAPVWIEGKCYSHPLGMNLYGLWENKESIKKDGICYVFEAEKSVLQCDTFGNNNAVAVCGSQFNKYQLNLLLQLCTLREVVICFDREEITGEDKYFNKLYHICDKYKEYCQFSFVYDREGLTNMKDSPSDHGKEVFEKLIERRVIVK